MPGENRGTEEEESKKILVIGGKADCFGFWGMFYKVVQAG
jgi:hypothetical protein